MVIVCQTCGDKGFPEALVYCKNCQACAHRYCLEKVTFGPLVWFCEECKPVNSKTSLVALNEHLNITEHNPLDPGDREPDGVYSDHEVAECVQINQNPLHNYLPALPIFEPMWGGDFCLYDENSKRIFGSLNVKTDIVIIEDGEPDENIAPEKKVLDDCDMPEWAKLLEPVKKLPTKNGSRIRNCVYGALAKNPPEWAKTKLKHSISKEVYKGNASGPTKRAVVSVLEDVRNECLALKAVSDIIMKKCRIILRLTAADDDSKIFCNFLGRRKLMNSSDNGYELPLGSRPLNFRTIDFRLAIGAYCGSHEAFVEDVHELWSNFCSAYAEQPNMVELADKLYQNFDSLYEKEVLTLVPKMAGYAKLESLTAEEQEEIHDILASASETPKAPWDDDALCKVCGIDKDNDRVLLCDSCDSEYHTYCLDTPLARVPRGKWYCPTCGIKMHR